MEKLSPPADLRIALYGMKPAFAEEIAREIDGLGVRAELLTEGTTLDLEPGASTD